MSLTIQLWLLVFCAANSSSFQHFWGFPSLATVICTYVAHQQLSGFPKNSNKDKNNHLAHIIKLYQAGLRRLLSLYTVSL
jgi:hypothetical protein